MATQLEMPTNGSYIDMLATQTLLVDSSSTQEVNLFDKDSSWISRSFMVNSVMLDDVDIENRSFSSASFKYTDSSLGGNFCINPPAQFTRYADIRDKGIRGNGVDTTISYSGGDIGMGSYYSEAIDDNSQVIHMRFGVPQYNSLTQFFTGFYSNSTANMARTGRVDSTLLEKFIKAASVAVAVTVFPLAIIPIALMAMGSAVRFFMRWPSSKFYYLKPAMPLYWKAVSSMINQIGVNKGVIAYIDRNTDNVINQEHKFTDEQYGIFNAIFPELNKSGLLDIYAIANKAKRLEMRHRTLMQKQYDESITNGDDIAMWRGRVKSIMNTGGGLDIATPSERTSFTLESYFNSWLSADEGGKLSEDKAGVEKSLRQSEEYDKMTKEQKAAAVYSSAEPSEGFLKHALAEAAEGGQWASFRVDYTGPVSESFSNSVGESSLAQKFNQASAGARDLRINFADGNIDSLGVASTVISGVGSLLSGAASLLQLDGLAAFAGNAFVDIPKHWESSTATLPKSNYTITLTSPYGNPVSQMMFMYVPLCMLIVGALPLAAGKQSYTSPFMCELYDRGRSITRLGMIDSLSIQRGTSNLGFNNEGAPMAIEVSFSVIDMSSIVTMPIDQGFSVNPLDGVFDGENSFSDYLMVLSSLHLRDAEQRFPMLKNQLSKKAADIGQFFSASHFGQVAANLPGISAISAVFRGAGSRTASGT